mmetsp:Transcript_130348/g.230319  ORF Transcript_130348/g.230319 Transcript_130348/m.230319 type:complete len:306 (+) Transcript_130348:112-1029(+)
MASQCNSLQSSSSSPHANGEFAGCGEDLCWPEMSSSQVFAQPPLASDFYCESDDGVRGVTLDLNSEMTSFCRAFVGYDEDGSAKACLKQSPTRQFTGRAAPRQLPDDDLEVTSVTVDPRATAADVCNILHAYTTSEVTATNVKINPKKYTIKADILHPDGATCTYKVCVYSKEPLGGLVVVFRRRGGDAIAFNRIFRHAAAYLHSHLEKHGDSHPEMERDLKAPVSEPTTPETDLQPLLDMLAAKGEERIQAEAAIALSAMAVVNASVAAHLCSTLSILPTLHRLQEYVLACASTRRTETFAFCV